jgi:hypothetical protein
MSEEQRKPAKKWHQYLLILVILLCVVGICIIAAGGHPTPHEKSLYHRAETELQNAVNDYQNRNNGALPTLNGTVTINSSAYKIIDICPLLTQSGESLKTVVESLWYGNGSNADNCSSGCAECTAYGNYIWAVDDEGNVYSTCVGTYCNASGVDGYQDVWP